MKREIEFRAKSIDGYWVFGDLHLQCKYPHIHTAERRSVPIDPKTIGQFTGLTDINGREIYEGDIIKEDNLVHQILWVDEASAFCRCNLKDADIRYRISRDAMSYVKVIGNIHDNPNLIDKGGKL